MSCNYISLKDYTSSWIPNTLIVMIVDIVDINSYSNFLYSSNYDVNFFPHRTKNYEKKPSGASPGTLTSLSIKKK